MFIVPSIHTRHAFSRRKDPFWPRFYKPDIPRDFLTHSATLTHTYIHTHTHTSYIQTSTYYAKYTKMGNITRYLGVARVVHVSCYKRRSRDPSFASSIAESHRGFRHFAPMRNPFPRRTRRPEVSVIHVLPPRDRRGTGRQPTREARLATRMWARAQREMLAVRWLLLRLLITANH